MHQRNLSSLTFIGTAIAATLAAALMSTAARAEGPIEDIRPTVGARSRAEVQAEVMANRHLITSFGGEYARHMYAAPFTSTATREQVRSEYLAAREQVRAMNAEDSGSGYLAMHKAVPAPVTMTAGAEAR